jgi:hypothetical protein
LAGVRQARRLFHFVAAPDEQAFISHHNRTSATAIRNQNNYVRIIDPPDVCGATSNFFGTVT